MHTYPSKVYLGYHIDGIALIKDKTLIVDRIYFSVNTTPRYILDNVVSLLFGPHYSLPNQNLTTAYI